MEREKREGIEEETAEGAEEVEELAASAEEPGAEDGVDKDGRAGGTQEPDDNSEVEEQKRLSDATLKRAIAPIADPLQRIG